MECLEGSPLLPMATLQALPWSAWRVVLYYLWQPSKYCRGVLGGLSFITYDNPPSTAVECLEGCPLLPMTTLQALPWSAWRVVLYYLWQPSKYCRGVLGGLSFITYDNPPSTAVECLEGCPLLHMTTLQALPWSAWRVVLYYI